MKKPIKRRPIIVLPKWKARIPRHPEHKDWKRDNFGFPIFHDDGVCVRCKGAATKFSLPQYAFKYQLLGYCEPCTTTVMGALTADPLVFEPDIMRKIMALL